MRSQPIAPRFLRAPSFSAALALAALAAPHAVFAQTATASATARAHTISALFEQAWAQHPLAVTAPYTAAQSQAQLTRAQSWVAAPPTLSTSVRTDSLTPSARREGLRETELEVSIPFTTPQRRSLQTTAATTQSEAMKAQVALERLKLAGEVREAYWALRLAQAEYELAQADSDRASQLAQDAQRRVNAGQSARVDALQAQAAAQQALVALNQASAAREAASSTLGLLVAASSPRTSPQFDLTAQGETAPASIRFEKDHPQLIYADTLQAAAKAQLAQTTELASTPPAVSFTVANERTREGISKNTAKVGVSVGFDAFFSRQSFNAPQIATAQREFALADAQQQRTERQVQTQIQAAQSQLRAAQAQLEPAKQRAQLANESAQLYDKAWRLGELDLPTRLRSEAERAHAQRDAKRAEIQVGLMTSRLNQALGLLP